MTAFPIFFIYIYLFTLSLSLSLSLHTHIHTPECYLFLPLLTLPSLSPSLPHTHLKSWSAQHPHSFQEGEKSYMSPSGVLQKSYVSCRMVGQPMTRCIGIVKTFWCKSFLVWIDGGFISCLECF